MNRRLRQIKRLLRAMKHVRIDTGIHPELRAVARKVWSRLAPEDQAVSHSGDTNADSDPRSPRTIEAETGGFWLMADR